MSSVTRVAFRHLQKKAMNKYDPGELLSQLVTLLDQFQLTEAVQQVKKITPAVQKAWQERDRDMLSPAKADKNPRR